MKNLFFKTALCFMAFGFLACDAAGGASGEVPIEVQTYQRENRFLGPTILIRYIKITAVADSVKIMDIIPNRGNCFVGGVADSKPADIYKELSFGQTWDLPVASCSRLLEVEVITDKGAFEFKF